MKELLFFVFRYYRVYLLILVSAAVVWGAAKCFFSRKSGSVGVKKRALIIFLVFVIACVSSFFVNRTPLLTDTVTVTRLEPEIQLPRVSEMQASDVSYFRFDVVQTDEDTITLRVPYGFERRLVFISGPETGMVQISSNVQGRQVSAELNLHADDYYDVVWTFPDNGLKACFLDLGLKLLLNSGLVLLLSWLVYTCITRTRAIRSIKKWVVENRYGVGIFLALMIHFLLYKAEKLNGWSSGMYVLDYSMGFGSRFFVGSVFSLFYDDFLSSETVYFHCAVCLVVLIALVSYLANAVIKKRNYHQGIGFLLMLYLAMPGSIASMWTVDNYGRLEAYNLVLTLITLLAFHGFKSVWVKYGIAAVLAVINMAIYQGNVFLYYPVFFIMVVCDCLRNKQIKTWIVAGTTIAITAVAFLIFQFFTHINFENADEMCAVVQPMTDLPCAWGAYHYEYFTPLSDIFEELTHIFLLGPETPRERTFLILCIFSPVVILLLAMWLKCWKKESIKEFLSKPYIYCLLGYLFFIPQFALNVDWGRWLSAVTFYSFYVVIYLDYLGFVDMRRAADSLGRYVAKYNMVFASMLIAYAVFTKFGAQGFPPEINTVWDWVYDLVIGPR